MRRLLSVLAIVALVAVGCGDDDDNGDGGASGTTAAPPVSLDGDVNNEGVGALDGNELSLEAKDFAFAPTFVDASAGTEVSVVVKNGGEALHTFTIDDPSVDIELDPGTSQSVLLTLPADGPLVFYCRFHRAQGMQGAFTYE